MVQVNIEKIQEHRGSGPLIKVMGIGGGGSNAVNRMVSAGIASIDFIVSNTDLQDLQNAQTSTKVQLGVRCARGLGAGAKPEIGREAAMEDLDTIRHHLHNADMVFLTAGLGGGTGTGAAPVIAEACREMNCLTVAVVTKPFRFEGGVRKRNAEEGIQQLRRHVDTLIVIPNDNLLAIADRQTTMIDAFAMADNVLRVAIMGISDLITKEALINLDFADVRTVMAGMGQAIMGTGTASGENRAVEAAERAIHSPLLDDCRIDGAKGILINVTGPPSLKMLEANAAVSYITEQADDDATIIFGADIKSEMPEDRLEVTVIATGFHVGEESNPPAARKTAMIQTLSSTAKEYQPRNSLPSDSMSSDSMSSDSMSSHSLSPSSLSPGSLSPGSLSPNSLSPAGIGLNSEESTNTSYEKSVEGLSSSAQSAKIAELDAENQDMSQEHAGDAVPPLGPVWEETQPSEIQQAETSRSPLPTSYRPEERSRRPSEADLDIPTFIRRRSKRFQYED